MTVVIDNQIAEQFALIFKELRQKGKPIPTNDMWIAAYARAFGFAVFTYDNHFSNIEGLKIIS